MFNYLTLLITLLFSVTASFAAQAQTSNQVSQQKAQTTNTAIGNNNATAVSVTDQNNQQSLGSSNSATPQHSIYIQVGQSVSNRSTATTTTPSQRSQTPSSQSRVRSEQFLIQKMAIESKERIAEQQIESNAKLSVFNRLIPDW